MSNIINNFLKNKIIARLFSIAILLPLAVFVMRKSSEVFQYSCFLIAAIMCYELVSVIIKKKSGTHYYKTKIYQALFFVFGLFYIFYFITSLIHIRNLPHGLNLIFLAFCLTWASDIGGYIFGIALQGPKIAPKISPNKTWSGFLGGCAMSLLAMFIAQQIWSTELRGIFFKHSGLLLFNSRCSPYLLAAATHCVGQMGDLLESWFKRCFGVKDSGKLIPGHGGVLDRLDSIMAVIIFWYYLIKS